jgi:hypothetical protein
MAIGTDAAIEFFGTPDTLGGTATAAVANDAFSTINATTGLNTWTNDDDAVMAKMVLEANFSVAPDANSVVNLFARPLNVQSTNDPIVPDATNQHVYMGSFPLKDGTSAQFIPLLISLLPTNFQTSQIYEFYLENKSGQSMPAGWDLHALPTALGPHP